MKAINKYSPKGLLLFIIFLFLTPLSYSQLSTDMVKYWYYRDRLNKYFVIPGGNDGESEIVCVRNKMVGLSTLNEFKNLDYGQHATYQGYYIGLLATEYYLLKENNQLIDAAKTLNELDMAINAVKVYWDEQAEPFWNQGEPYPPSNGFL